MHAHGLTFSSPLAPELSTSAPLAFRVDVHREANTAVLEAWAWLEQVAPCSIYQTRAWLLPWAATMGRKAGLAPLFVLAFGADERPLALLCLGVRRHGVVKVASFLGGKDSNFMLPLVRPGANWTPSDVRRLLGLAAQGLGLDAPDAFVLTNQSQSWGGAANPFHTLSHQPSPSAAYGTALPSCAEDFFAAKLSKDSRKKLRKKEARLAEIGPVTHIVASTGDERKAVLAAFLVQRLARFRAQHIVSEFDDPHMHDFLVRASTGDEHGAGIELHALKAGSKIVAVYGGGAHGGAWSGMFNSFDTDPEIAKSSPGDLLLMKVIAAQCEAGRTRFDLGIGEARYKATFCDEAILLFDTFIPLSARGWGFVAFEKAKLSLKRAIKQNPHLFDLARRLRGFGSPTAPQAT